MAEKFSAWDAADHLDDLDDIAAFLQAALEDADDDPSFLPIALGTIARSHNFSELARKVGMSREGLYKALSAEGTRPSSRSPAHSACESSSTPSPETRHQATRLTRCSTERGAGTNCLHEPSVYMRFVREVDQ